jgi:hypothetical protein
MRYCAFRFPPNGVARSASSVTRRCQCVIAPGDSQRIWLALALLRRYGTIQGLLGSLCIGNAASVAFTYRPLDIQPSPG